MKHHLSASKLVHNSIVSYHYKCKYLHHMQNMSLIHYLQFIPCRSSINPKHSHSLQYPNVPIRFQLQSCFWCDSQDFPPTGVKCVSYVKIIFKKLYKYKYIISAALKVQTSCQKISVFCSAFCSRDKSLQDHVYSDLRMQFEGTQPRLPSASPSHHSPFPFMSWNSRIRSL